MVNIRVFNKLALTMFLIVCFAKVGYSRQAELESPNGKIRVDVNIDRAISYSVSFNGKPLILPSKLSLDVEKIGVLGLNPQVQSITKTGVSDLLRPVLPTKNNVIKDSYNRLVIDFSGNYSVIFRAYDDGVAYRFVTNFNEPITINQEQVCYNFPDNNFTYFPQEENYISHNQRIYEYLAIDKVVGKQCILPVMVVNDGIKLLITEADLEDYPGLYLYGGEDGKSFQGKHPGYVLEYHIKKDHRGRQDRQSVIDKRADYIAKVEGARVYPWRVCIIAQEDAQLLESEMIYKLGSPCRIEDTSWIEPGKVAWDWYNYNNLYGVDFRAGVNTETYKYYIDFASKYGIEYVILDEGWYKLGDLFDINPDMDMDELFKYAKQKNVGIILWVVWKTLEDQMDEALDKFALWGAKGIKVDFMQRDDQAMVQYYYRVAQEAAKRKLLVNFHGCYKPEGLRRTYPNVLTREAVEGLEANKWSEGVTPDHNLTLPFTRMAAGPMDYTPGAMVNAQKVNFRDVFNRPMSQGTRAHQLAMYVIYESPMQMLADSPSHYLREPQIMEYLSAVPAVWDEMKVLEAKISDYIVMAKRSGEDWYIGAMCDWTAREFDTELSFLGKGKYTAHIYKDGINADRYGSDYKYESKKVTNKDTMKINLAPGGGCAVRFTKD